LKRDKEALVQEAAELRMLGLGSLCIGPKAARWCLAR